MGANKQIMCCHFLTCGSKQCEIAHSITISNQIRVVFNLQHRPTFISGLSRQTLASFRMSQEKMQ
ncbi:hypothetical protein CF116_00705 [Aeromonas veronii]|nr:hypothetical protein CF116_00705 [Aeromonas veronii]